MSKKYYTLRFERDDAFHKTGYQIANADNTLYIGQTESCDIKIANESQYEDAILAVIEKRTDDKGWKIISVSPYKEHEVHVNGTPINHVHFLSHGDRISFAGQRQELVFNIREDDKYTSSGIVSIGKRDNHSLLAGLTLFCLALIGILLLQFNTQSMSRRMIESAKQSVFQIKVDSVQMVAHYGDSTVICRTAYLKDEYGTAFLTTDGSLVTARHCIEPWLNLPDNTRLDTSCKATPPHIRLALEAVTRNIIAENENDSTRWQMVSYCSLRKPEVSDSVLLRVTSTEFVMNDSRDHIMEFGDYDHQYFWRSIKVRPHRTDMMLGDIAFLPDAAASLHQNGTIRMASKNEVTKLCQKANRDLNIIGRMSNNTGSEQLQSPNAQLLLQITEANCHDGYPDIVIAHDGNISHGFSGGPVLTRQGLFKWCVIGVVSVTDDSNENWYYSVPISEIERMNNK